MKTMKQTYFQLATMLVLIGLLLSSCAKTGSEPEFDDPAPEIPPLETLLIDFADFDTTTTSALGKTSGNATITKANWRWAAFNIGVWNVVLTLNLAVPVAAFTHSFQHNGVAQPGGGWLWTYNYTVAGRTYTANLSAQAITNGIRWEMRISQQGGYQDFLWFHGESNLLLRQGFWVLSNNPNNPVDYLRIDWNRDPDNNSADIRYTIITPGGAENGSYIFYGVNENQPYNAFYDIFSVSRNNLVEIEWHRGNHNGHVKDPRHFSDSDWHCWDGNFDDTTCP